MKEVTLKFTLTDKDATIIKDALIEDKCYNVKTLGEALKHETYMILSGIINEYGYTIDKETEVQLKEND